MNEPVGHTICFSAVGRGVSDVSCKRGISSFEAAASDRFFNARRGGEVAEILLSLPLDLPFFKT